MFKKFLIVASKEDKAGINITTQLSKFGDFNFYLVERDILHNENLDLARFQEYDFIIFASKHASESKEKTISIHAPGNWKEARAGGMDKNVCVSSALFNKFLFKKLEEKIKEGLIQDKYKLTLECTHHGPFIQKPCLFVEIGATDFEWGDKSAGFIVARAIKEAIETFTENPYNEIAVGVGGPHYCPGFNKIQLDSNVAISHVIPSYAYPFTAEMILDARKKTVEDVDFFVIDWKGLKAEERDLLVKILDENYIQWKKTGDIKKGKAE